MNNTLDSIHPSEIDPQQDMSYLFGRDPSILAYGQRHCIAKDTKRNLLTAYELEEDDTAVESTLPSCETPTVKVYLRLKPFPKKMKLSSEQEEAYQIINSTTLSTRLPVLDSNASHLKRSKISDVIYKKFTFTQTFGPETTQLELFESVVKPQMTDFLAGQNCTIMTYGTTNSGKSYTLQGTTFSPGIIPRSLEFVFSNITPKTTPSYKPIHHCDVISLSSYERGEELEWKAKLLTFGSADKSQCINTYKEMQKLLQEESPIRPSQCNDAHYSVWVTFAEIYNETVYDLLSNENQKKRQPLKLATDSHGRTFIKGLRTVCVNSGSEAYQVLMAGQYNLKVAATALNAKSSRSHCIFTIKLLKYYSENTPDAVEVSTFAFCDLAGSERLKKTLNIGDRLKEAQNINTSLLVLGRCLKSIHEGQLSKQKADIVGPFRESKLTRLFQRALSGKEHIALVVNVNPIPNLYDETQNVLNFSAIAKKIVIEQKERIEKKTRSRFSQIVKQSIKTVTDWDTTELDSTELRETTDQHYESGFIHPEDYDDLVNENERLKKEIETIRGNALTRDLQIRQEMADTYTAMIKQLEIDWRNRIKDIEEQQEDAREWSVKQVEHYYKQKIQQLNSRKRMRISDSEEDEEEDDAKHAQENLRELEQENDRLTSKLIVMKDRVKELRETNHTLCKEKNTASFEFALAKDDLKCMKELLEAAQKDLDLDEDSQCYIEELKAQLFAKQEQVKKLKQFLEEAKEEYIEITTDAREKEDHIKKQDEIIMEQEERIGDLQEQLEDANICAIENTKMIEVLENKLECQARTVVNAETEIKHLKSKIEQLEEENAMLQRKTASSPENEAASFHRNEEQYKKEVVNRTVESKDCEDQEELIIKEEIVSDAERNTSTESEETAHNQSDESAHNQSEENTHYQAERELEAKILEIKEENSVLKCKLVHSTMEIDSLKEALDTAKVRLKEISQQMSQIESRARIAALKNTESHEKSSSKVASVELKNDKETGEECIFLETSNTESVQENVKVTVKECHNRTRDEDNEVNVSIETSELELKQVFQSEKEKIDKSAVYLEDSSLMEASLCENSENSQNSEKRNAKETDVDNEETEQVKEVVGVNEKSSFMENDEEESFVDKSSQTVDNDTSVSETSTQTEEFVDAALIKIKEELTDADSQCKELRELYAAECLRVAEITKELSRLKETVESLTSETGSNKILIEEYKQSVESLKDELEIMKEQKLKIKEELNESEVTKRELKENVERLELQIGKMESELSAAKDCETFNSEKLANMQAEFEKRISECTEQYEVEVEKLKTELRVANEECENQKKTVHRDLVDESVTKQLRETIEDLHRQLDARGAEKINLENLLEKGDEKCKRLQDKIEELTQMLSEKDEEIDSLQRDLKSTIRPVECEDESLMQQGMKDLIKKLTEEQDRCLTIKQELEEVQRERDRLRTTIRELETSLEYKEMEMETFSKNRKEAETRYENLLKAKHEELEREKREVMRFQELFHRQTTSASQKDECKELQLRIEDLQDKLKKFESRDPDLLSPTERRTRRRGKRSPPAEIAVIDLSGSESKRNTRQTTLLPPNSADKKKATKKKKLFVADESVQDIEAVENTAPASRCPETRSLRRKKK